MHAMKKCVSEADDRFSFLGLPNFFSGDLGPGPPSSPHPATRLV